MTSRFEEEVERRKRRGCEPKTLRQVIGVLADLGYKLDRTLDCKSDNRYLTGEDAGKSYPAINAYVVECDSGLSFADVAARRDENFRRLQELRKSDELYAVIRGRILEI